MSLSKKEAVKKLATKKDIAELRKEIDDRFAGVNDRFTEVNLKIEKSKSSSNSFGFWHNHCFFNGANGT